MPDISSFLLLALVTIMLGVRIAAFLKRQGGSQVEQIGGFVVIAICLAIIWFILNLLGIVKL